MDTIDVENENLQTNDDSLIQEEVQSRLLSADDFEEEDEQEWAHIQC